MEKFIGVIIKSKTITWILKMQEPSENAHWRDSARSVRFFVIDYKAAFPLVLLLLFQTWSMVIVAVGAVVFFSLLFRFGYTLEVFFRLGRSWIAGSRKVAIPWWRN